MKVKYCLAFAALICVCFAPPVSAAVIEYTSLATFNAAVSSATMYNFDGVTPDSINPTVGGVTFADGLVIGVDAGNGYSTSFFAGQTTDLFVPSRVTATLTSGVTAIGFRYGSYMWIDSGIPLTVTLSTGDIFHLYMPITGDPGAQNSGITDFIGFTSDTPIMSVDFAHMGYSMDITQFTTGSAASSVPIPPSLLLFAPGLLGLVGLRRRFKK